MTTAQAAHLKVDGQWLALNTEPVLDPQQPIIDPHHHLWTRAGWPYSVADLMQDAGSGHDVRATIFVECRMHYRTSGPASLQPVGETEWVVGSTAALPQSGVRIGEGIVAHANLRLGAAVEEVLQVQMAAGAGRLKGIRHSTAWDADPLVFNPELGSTQGQLADAGFREGVRRLGRHGLVFDSWNYHPQLPELCALAGTCPDTTIVIDHTGGPVGIGSYAGQGDETFKTWRVAIRELARHPNVRMKLGGLAMRISGSDFHQRTLPPTSMELAQTWRPWIESSIEAFGPDRCMFESNFPVDKASCSYAVLWNAFKRIVAGASKSEKHALFARSAARCYGLEDTIGSPPATKESQP